MLKDFTPRLYQETILATAANNNTLVVLPTGLGKTAIALLMAVQCLTKFPNSKILMLAPTKPLCEQHLATFQQHLDIPADKIVLFTGDVAPEKRAQLWKEASIVVSTPQCVTGDTIIYSKKNGLISIKTFVESFKLNKKKYGKVIGMSAEIQEEILGWSNNKIGFVKATKCWKLPCKKIFYLKTEMCNEIQCTSEHPLLTITELGEIKWEKAENIEKNSYIAMAVGAQIEQRTVDTYDLFKSTTLSLVDSKLISHLFSKLRKTGYKDNRYYNYKRRSMPLEQFFSDAKKVNLSIPSSLNVSNSTGRSEIIKIGQKLYSDTAYIIGAMLADGHIGNRDKAHGNEVVYSELFYPSILERFSDKVEKVFGIKPNYNDPLKGLIYFSTAFAEVLEKFGVPYGKKSHLIRVPKYIFHSDIETILCFLSGILNADGDFHKNMIRYCSVSQKFIEDLRWLLLRLEIPSSLEIRHAKKGKIGTRVINVSKSYHLIISGVNNINKIIFHPDIDIAKSKNLRALSELKKIGTRSKDILPVKKALQVAYKEHRRNGGKKDDEFRIAYHRGYLSKEYLRKTLPRLNSPKALALLKIIDLPLRWVKVKEKVERDYNEDVYDLTVDEEHNFVSNLLISHNTVENDVINGRVELKDASLLVLDEAHHAVKDYSYVWLAQQYNKNSNSRILALTASPGSDIETIKDVCNNLFIEKVEVRTERDDDVKSYLQEIRKNWVEVELPAELKRVQKLLVDCKKMKLSAAQTLGYCHSIDISKSELLALQAELHKKVSAGDFDMLKSISLLAEALKVDHALELLETQGIPPLHKYMRKMQQEALTSNVKATKNLMMDQNFKAAAYLIEEIINSRVQHPKIIKLQQLLQVTLESKPKAKIIVFTQFRDSAEEITFGLDSLKSEFKISNHIFVGQAKKNGIGFSQKQQKEVLDRFRGGEFSVLVATSVAEEGLDIPKVDEVIFYEPIPSAIRSIQRRGRTGRLEKGEVTILVTKGTRDEAYRWSAHHKEKRMYSNLDKLKKEFTKIKADHTMALEKKESQTIIPVDHHTTLAQHTTLDKFADTVLILADNREKNNSIVKELINLGISVRTDQLESADYVVSGRVGVELKKVPDFVASILDGRMIEQAREIKKHFERSVLIIEGEEDLYAVRNVHPNAIRGMIASIVLGFGIPILYTKDPADTAALLAVMAKREQQKETGHVEIQGKAYTQDEQLEFVVSALPGIGRSTAKVLLQHFGSIKILVNATEEDLTKIKGIGTKTAEKLVGLFGKMYGQ